MSQCVCQCLRFQPIFHLLCCCENLIVESVFIPLKVGENQSGFGLERILPKKKTANGLDLTNIYLNFWKRDLKIIQGWSLFPRSALEPSPHWLVLPPNGVPAPDGIHNSREGPFGPSCFSTLQPHDLMISDAYTMFITVLQISWVDHFEP